MKELGNYYIKLRENLHQKDYEDISGLQKLCMETDKVNLKLEIDYKLQLAESKPSNTNEINEFMYYNDSNKLIGYIGICDFGGDAIEVHGMVHPEYRRKGVFRRLFSLVKDEWLKRQSPKMELLSDNSSISGLEFIKSTGAKYAYSEHEMYLRDFTKLKIESNKVVLRKATNDDAEEIERIYCKCFDEEYKEENIIMPEDEEKLGIIYYIAEVANRPIGKINLAIGNVGSIYGFGILPEHRGKGYGKETLIRSIEKLKEYNCKDIMIQVESLNNALYAPLLVIDANGTRYYLAESLTSSEDYLTHTLKLKEGLKWHDGEPITADDIVFTINSILDENQNSHLRSKFLVDGKPIEVRKVDELTVDFILPQVSAPFMSSISGLRPIPQHVFEGEADLAKSEKNLSPVGSGPFKFKEIKSGEKVELVRFDDYFDGKPNLDGVVFRVIADANSANTALLNGELSARYITTDDIDKFSNNDKFYVGTFDEGMLNNMVFRLTNEALQNEDVRKAIAYAIDKDEIVTGVYKSEEYAEKAYSVFVPNTKYYTNNVEKYDYDVEKAKELLTNAGYENLSLRLAYTNSSKEQEAYGLIMQQQLQKIGVELELIPMERGAFLQKFIDATTTDFDLAYNGFVMGLEPNGYSPLFTAGSSNNFMGYVNEELDQIWDQGVIETDEAKRAEIYEKIQKQIIDDMVVYPIVYPKSIVAVSSDFGGVEEAKLVPITMFEDLSKLYKME